MARLVTSLLVFLMLAAVSPGFAQSVSKDIARAPNGAYQMDTAHSQVLFSILHLGLTDYYGRFDKLTGTLNLDANQPERSAVTVTIDTSSIDVPSSRLVTDLKSVSTFDTAQFPSASFRSTSIVRTGPGTGRITGDLTIKNVTRPVVLEATFHGGESDPMNDTYAIGFHATATIRRSDFGLTTMPWSSFVGDDVGLIIEAMFQHEKS